jgi:hopanoid biosynthesis associated protein HpnK
MKKLIVNADDFGFTAGVNEGIARAFQKGIVTSASIMAAGPAFDDAVERARSNPHLSVGCHLMILGAAPVSPPRQVPSLIDSDGRMPRNISRLMAKLLGGSLQIGDIEREFRAQVDRVVAARIMPTHLDTHKHTHGHPSVMAALSRVARDFRIPSVRNPFESLHYPRSVGAAARARRGEHWKQFALSMAVKPAAARFRRLARANGLRTPDYFCGVSLTGLLDGAAILAIVRSLREGTTELVCHPGIYDEDLEKAPTRLKREREAELLALVDHDVLSCIQEQGVTLISYRDLVS